MIVVGKSDMIGISQSYARSMEDRDVSPIVSRRKSGSADTRNARYRSNLSTTDKSNSTESCGGFRAGPSGSHNIIDFLAFLRIFFLLVSSSGFC